MIRRFYEDEFEALLDEYMVKSGSCSNQIKKTKPSRIL